MKTFSLLAFLTLLLPSTAVAMPIGFVYDGSQYTIYTQFTNTRFLGINDAGTIVGGQTPGTPGSFGVVVQDGVLTRYEFGFGLTGSGVSFHDIDSNGVIVGSGIIGDGYSSFVVRDGEVTSRFHYGFTGINDAGIIVSHDKLFTASGDSDEPHSELNTANTTINYPGADSTHAADINNSKVIAGSFMDGFQLYGFVGDTVLPALPGGLFVTGLNDVGQVVGFTAELDSFLYDSHTGALTRFAHPHFPTFAQGINNNGMIVGYVDVQVPEPSTLLLLGMAVGPLGFCCWRRRRHEPLD